MKRPRTVGDVMTHAVGSVGCGAPFRVAWSMQQWTISAQPVLSEEGRVVAVVCEDDLPEIFLRPADDIAEDVRSELLTVHPTGSPEVVVQAENGVVALTGSVPRQVPAEALLRVTRAVPDVVEVQARLDAGPWKSAGPLPRTGRRGVGL